MKKTSLTLLVLITTTLLLFGCGGGGGSSTANVGGNNNTPQPTPQPTTAIVKILTTGTLPAGTKIGGIDVTVSLPAGVSVKCSANPPVADAGTVVISNATSTNTSFVAIYSAPTSTLPGRARILIASSTGLGEGEFAMISGDIAAGNYPKAADFTVTNLLVTDLNGVDISGLTAGLTADIR